MRKNTPEYYMGKLVGEIIYYKYLPTLNVDSLKSKIVIRVTDEEKEKCDTLHQILNDTYSDGMVSEIKYGIKKSTEVAHTNWIDYINELSKIYLPKKLECRFEKIEISDINQFKLGITDFLWDTDLSWYLPEDDFWKTTNDRWASEVVLTRTS
jgi:hypothetical protein